MSVCVVCVWVRHSKYPLLLLLLTYNAFRIHQKEMADMAILFATKHKLGCTVAALSHQEVPIQL